MLRLNRNLPWALAAALSLTALAPLRALDVTEWKTRQPLAVERAGVVKLALPPATLDAARPGLEDLRLLDPAGRETPFVFERPAPGVPAVARAPRSFRSTLGDATTELRVETGTPAPLDAIVLATPAPNFLKAARLEISADDTHWETVSAGTPVFRQFGAEQLRFALDGRTAAYVRVTIDDTRSRPVPFTGATLQLAATARPAVTTPLPVRVLRRDEFSGESLLTLDLGAANVPLAALEFTTAEPLFARNVTVSVRELREDAAVERTLASGSIWRVALDGRPATARLDVPVDFAAPSRELLVHLVNHDSPPLAIEGIVARQRPLWLVFRAAEPGTYTLLTGHPLVAAPRYDLATLAGSLRDTVPGDLTPGALEANPAYRRPETLPDTPLRGAALDPAPWAWRKSVRLEAGGVQELELDLDVLARAQPGLGDPRLVREGAQVPYLLERTALSRSSPLALAPSATDPQRPSVSRWTIKLPRAAVPFTRLTLTASTALFQRHLRLSEKIANDRGETYERTLATADWNRTPGNSDPLTLSFSSPPDTDTLWLETDNGDNPPLALTTAVAAYPVVRLLFRAEPGPLALYYGNPSVNAPRYDLALVSGQILVAEKSVATLGPAEKTSGASWTSDALAGLRGGPLFWGALALVVVVLLVVVAKLLPKPPAPTA